MAMRQGHSYPASFGFTGSAGSKPVTGYMRGGHVKHHKAGGAAEHAKPDMKGEFKRGGHMKPKMAKGGSLAAGMKKYAVGGVVSAGEYKVPSTASPIYKYAKGGRVATAGPKSPKKMSGYPKMAGEYKVPPTSFKKYAKGGKIESPVGKIAKASDSNEKWEDYKHGGMKKARGGRC